MSTPGPQDEEANEGLNQREKNKVETPGSKSPCGRLAAWIDRGLQESDDTGSEHAKSKFDGTGNERGSTVGNFVTASLLDVARGITGSVGDSASAGSSSRGCAAHGCWNAKIGSRVISDRWNRCTKKRLGTYLSEPTASSAAAADAVGAAEEVAVEATDEADSEALTSAICCLHSSTLSASPPR